MNTEKLTLQQFLGMWAKSWKAKACAISEEILKSIQSNHSLDEEKIELMWDIDRVPCAANICPQSLLQISSPLFRSVWFITHPSSEIVKVAHLRPKAVKARITKLR